MSFTPDSAVPRDKCISDPLCKWMVSWGCAQQLTEPDNNPPPPYLAGNTLRQILRSSAGGNYIRIKLSNLFSDAEAELRSVKIAFSSGGSEIDAESVRQVFFNGKSQVTISPKKEVWSDMLEFELPARSLLAVSIHFGTVSSDNVTGHPGSRTVSYIKKGDCAADPALPDAAETEHWYILAGIEVRAAQDAATLVAIGDSLTDGRGSDTGENNRWPDNLVNRLDAAGMLRNTGVYNAGIGGNAVLKKGLGPTLLERFRRDVLSQSNVKWVVILEGVNDFGPEAGKGRKKTMAKAKALIKALGSLARKARKEDVKVFILTIPPFGESFYYSRETEEARQAVNSWIRAQSLSDAVIDIEKALADPQKPYCLRPEADSGDHLHLSPEGYRILSDCIDPALFRRDGA